MTTLASLRILLGLDAAGVKGASQSVRADLRGVQDEARNTQSTLSQVGKGVVAGFGLGAGISTFNLASRAVSEFTDFLGDSVRAAAAEEAGIARLNQALAANVQGYSGDRSAIEKAISTREQLGFADDALRDSLSGLVAATHDVNRALEIQSAAEDLARFKGISLQEASDALVKVEAGRFRILASLGIQLKDNATQEDALRAVQAVAAGQAEAFGKTTEGAMQRAQVAVHNLEEEIGTKLLPVIGEAANLLNGLLVPAEADLTDQTQLAGAVLNLLATDPIAALNGGLAELAGKATAAAINQGRLTEAQLNAAREAHNLSERTDENVHDFGNLADAAKGVDANFTDAADSARVLLGQVDALTGGVGGLSQSLADIPTDISVKIDVGLSGAGAGAFARGFAANAGPAGNTDFTVGSPTGSLAGTTADPAFLASEADRRAREAAAAHDKALRDQADADRKYASDMRDRLQNAYQSVDETAKRYFADVHTARLKDIDDVRDMANREIDEHERAIRGFVDQQSALVDAARAHRQELSLRADVANAVTPEDRTRAQQALNDFLDDQRLAFLRSQADQQVAVLDAQKAANDTQAADQKAAENDRYQAQLDAFTAEEKLLRKHLDNATKDWAAYFREIAALAKRYGVADIVGVYPNPATATGRKAEAAASITASTPDYPARQPEDVGSGRMLDSLDERPIEVHVYLDVEEVGAALDRRSSRLNAIYSPIRASTGSQR